jgi:hypothetical protein
MMAGFQNLQNQEKNSFVVPKADYENMSVYEQDNYDLNALYEILEKEVIPAYYEDKNK